MRRCTRCWSTSGRCRSRACAADWHLPNSIRRANPSNLALVDRDIPFQISAAAARAVQEDGGIRSAPTLLNLLQQATAIADRTELIAPIDEPEAPARQQFRENLAEDPEAQARRRKALFIGLGVGGAVIIIALVLLGTVLTRIFGDVGDGLGGDEFGLNAPGSSTESSSGSAGETVKPVSATVFSPEGEADAPAEARLAIDGNPTTVWPTDTYTDPVPSPTSRTVSG